ncbi:TfuA-like protein [Pseudomonas sp. NPDC087358]|uniref:TfuA-like protein n=1 Tax=Pseudomonas sp. NPDC087358 TaxID=3364439 RepID=UPI00384A8D08
MKLHLFVGPTGSGLEQTLAEQHKIVVHSPAKRGDITALIDRYPVPGTIAIVDGTFHSFPSVGHIEIRHALQEGWVVWGLASMGAIRACEMRLLGMRGYGHVYRQYCEDLEFDDDEVTLVHEIDAPYRALSEPLIHIRGFVSALQGMQALSAERAQAIITDLKERWYGERTLPRLKRLLLDTGKMRIQEVEQALSGFNAYRFKSQDLHNFLASRCWCAGGKD